MYAIKGDAFTFGFTEGAVATLPAIGKGIPLSATENGATIFGGTNIYPETVESATSTTVLWSQNNGIDDPQSAFNSAKDPLLTHQFGDNEAVTGEATWRQVNTSNPPVLLTVKDVDFCSARTRGLTHKLFTNFGYIWKDHECITPYVGVGGEVEFAQHDNCYNNCNNSVCASSSCNTTCNSNCGNGCGNNGDNNNNSNCRKVALSQWGVWVKGGVAFN